MNRGYTLCEFPEEISGGVAGDNRPAKSADPQPATLTAIVLPIPRGSSRPTSSPAERERAHPHGSGKIPIQARGQGAGPNFAESREMPL